MKRLSTVLFTSLLICLLCSGTRSGYAGEARGVTDDTIKIGFIMDQTGVAASATVPSTHGARTYLQNINDKGGINGRKVKIIVEDDHYSIPVAVAAFKKLIFKDKVLSLFMTGTGQAIAVTNQIEKHKVPLLTISLAEELVTPVKRYIFIPGASYGDGVKCSIDYIMKDLKAKNPRIACVYPDIEIGKSVLRAAEEYLPKYNLKLSNKTTVGLGEIDATSQVLNLKRSKPDYIILQGTGAGVISFYMAAKRYGLRGKIFGTLWVGEEDHVKATGDAMKGTLTVSPIGYWSDNTPGMTELRKITKKYRPGTNWVKKSYTQGWLISMIYAEGAKRAGRHLNPDTLVGAYETFKNFSTGGISGPVSYSKDNHKGGTTNKLYKLDIENQTFIPITEYRGPAFKD